MKISMWMLADRLSSYHPKCQIHEGKRILQNARILSDSTKMSRYTVYLSPLSEDRIALLNGVDIIYVTCDDIHLLLDEVLTVFERYNEWRNGISEMMSRPCTVSDLFREFCQAKNQYYILADASYYVLEQFGEEHYLNKNSKAKKVLLDRIMPVDLLMNINRQPQVRMAEQPSYLIHLPELDNVSCVTNLFVNHVHHGWLIANNEANKFSQGDRDLQDEMGLIISRWLSMNADYEKNMQKSGIFLDIIEQNYSSTDLILRRLEGFSWYMDDRKIIYVILQNSENPEQTRVLDRFLQHTFPYTFVFRFQGRLILLANTKLTAEKDMEEALCRILRQYGCAAGKSSYFSDIFQLRKYMELAGMAAEYRSDRKQRISGIEDSLLPYSLHLLKSSAAVSVLHPALKKLRTCDAEHHSEYYLSLETFLLEERNYQRAAERLHIHRSTLIYRISKITELFHIDLENPDTRLHLLLSFRLQRQPNP